MLVLAGAGLSPDSITLEVIDVLKSADIVYVETYTSPSSKWILDLALAYNPRVVHADRRMLEEESYKIIEEARNKLVLVISPGDPLVATTHQALLAEAILKGVEARYLPGVSGVTVAKTYSGLSYYRFGRTVTAPGPWRGFKPYSTLAIIYGNLCIDSHTLILLDVNDEGLILSPGIAVSLLLEAEREASTRAGIQPIVSETPLLVVSVTAREKLLLAYENPLDLAREVFDSTKPASLIAPAPLNANEAWILETRLNRRIAERWIKRNYTRRDACRAYETLLDWLSTA